MVRAIDVYSANLFLISKKVFLWLTNVLAYVMSSSWFEPQMSVILQPLLYGAWFETRYQLFPSKTQRHQLWHRGLESETLLEPLLGICREKILPGFWTFMGSHHFYWTPMKMTSLGKRFLVYHYSLPSRLLPKPCLSCYLIPLFLSLNLSPSFFLSILYLCFSFTHMLALLWLNILLQL